jgi:hypothetical protein
VYITFGNAFVIVSARIYNYCGKETASLKNIIQGAAKNNLKHLLNCGPFFGQFKYLTCNLYGHFAD